MNLGNLVVALLRRSIRADFFEKQKQLAQPPPPSVLAQRAQQQAMLLQKAGAGSGGVVLSGLHEPLRPGNLLGLQPLALLGTSARLKHVFAVDGCGQTACRTRDCNGTAHAGGFYAHNALLYFCQRLADAAVDKHGFCNGLDD